MGERAMSAGWTRTDIIRLSVVWGAAAGLGVAVVTRDWLPGYLSTGLSLVAFAAVAGRAPRGGDRAALAEVRAAPVIPPIPEAELAQMVARLAEPATETAAPAVAGPPAPSQPKAMAAPGDGAADDLKRIKGVGKKLEALLHSLGVYQIDQIAGWTANEVAWMDEHLEGFRGRVTRDDWVGQARTITAARSDPGAVPTSRV